MEATLAMASLGRFNPDEPHLKMSIKQKISPYIWTLYVGKYSRNFSLWLIRSGDERVVLRLNGG